MPIWGPLRARRRASPWSKGVYRRDFENGIAPVNPKGNGSQEVDPQGRVLSDQGQAGAVGEYRCVVTKVTLKDRDGIILMRKEPVKRPRPPDAIFGSVLTLPMTFGTLPAL